MKKQFEVWINHYKFEGWKNERGHWRGPAEDSREAASLAADRFLRDGLVSSRSVLEEPLTVRVIGVLSLLPPEFFRVKLSLEYYPTPITAELPDDQG